MTRTLRAMSAYEKSIYVCIGVAIGCLLLACTIIYLAPTSL